MEGELQSGAVEEVAKKKALCSREAVRAIEVVWCNYLSNCFLNAYFKSNNTTQTSKSLKNYKRNVRPTFTLNPFNASSREQNSEEQTKNTH